MPAVRESLPSEETRLMRRVSAFATSVDSSTSSGERSHRVHAVVGERERHSHRGREPGPHAHGADEVSWALDCSRTPAQVREREEATPVVALQEPGAGTRWEASVESSDV